MPEWLTGLLREIAECYECIPNVIAWTAIDQGEGWEVTIYPAPTEVEGEIAHPMASVDVGQVIAHFDGAVARWTTTDDSEEITVDGRTEDGHELLLVLRLDASEDVPAMTRFLADRWVPIDRPAEDWTRLPDLDGEAHRVTAWARLLRDDDEG